MRELFLLNSFIIQDLYEFPLISNGFKKKRIYAGYFEKKFFNPLINKSTSLSVYVL